MQRREFLMSALLVLTGANIAASGSAAAALQFPKDAVVVQVLTKDGQTVEGALASPSLTFTLKTGSKVEMPLSQILSLHSASPASPQEQARIPAAITAVGGTDHAASEAAVADLTDLGLTALSPLLAAYKDTDVHEPNPLYRLFARLVPGYADDLDRSLDMLRLRRGAVRGKWQAQSLMLTDANGKTVTVEGTNVRRLAVRQRRVDKTFDVDALHHCTQIEFLDSGVGLVSESKIEATATGLVRLSFNIDGWASDPDGLQKPGPNYKTNLTDGLPFGALVGRVGAKGTRWVAGKDCKKEGLTAGRLYFAVNDNPHWQNNIGSYRVRLRVTDAYDLGDAQ